MKKHVMMLLMAVLTALPGLGQTHYEAQMSLGVHGGVNLSQVMFSPSIRQKFLPGANAGINFRYILHSNTDIPPKAPLISAYPADLAANWA